MAALRGGVGTRITPIAATDNVTLLATVKAVIVLNNVHPSRTISSKASTNIK